MLPEGAGRRRGAPLALRGLLALTLLALAAGPAPLAAQGLLPVPQADDALLEPAVRRELAAAHQEVEELRGRGEGREALAASYGRLGGLLAAYELFEAAEASFENARRLDGSDFRWSYYLAYVEQRRGELEQAAVHLEEALALAPDDLAARLRLGEVRFSLGQLGEARAAFERALALDPGAAAAHFGLGKVLASQGDHAGAAERFERALALQPQAALLHYPLAQAYRHLGRTEEARRQLALRGEAPVSFPDPLVEALSAGASGGGLAKFQGDQAVLAGRLEEAAAAYRRAVAADPERFAYRKSLGSTLYHLGRPEEARRELSAALSLSPEGTPAEQARQKAEIHHALGGIAANQGRVAEAIRHFQAAVGLDPELTEAHYHLGNLLGRAGRLEEALGELDRALELAPEHADARLQRATTLMDLGRFTEAVPELEERLRLVPGDERARWLLNVARQRAGSP